ncbi:MAG: glycosyltransferase family 2 protein [bacterium]|nr:glycosyltransferase family 2 protein [bacterium]
MLIYSFIIPTLNAHRTLRECLEHVSKQNYPKEKVEIISADGGSTDGTIDILKEYGVKIIANPLKTGEAGKMAGLKAAQGEYVVFLDSDNILIDPDWLTKLEKPFSDPEIVATESIYFLSRKSDNSLTRYFAYMGMGDPINLFLGNYDHINAITNRWTSLNVPVEQKQGFLKIHLFKDKPLPTVGANGFVVRRTLLNPLLKDEYLFDVDVMNLLMESNNETNSCYMAKVDTGLVHLFTPDIKTFVRKQQRRVRDYVYYQSKNLRVSHDTRNIFLKLLYPGGPNFTGLLLFIASCFTIIPLLVQALIGFVRKPDWVWIFHPLLCEITLFVYTTERLKSFVKKGIYDRSKWSQ